MIDPIVLAALIASPVQDAAKPSTTSQLRVEIERLPAIQATGETTPTPLACRWSVGDGSASPVLVVVDDRPLRCTWVPTAASGAPTTVFWRLDPIDLACDVVATWAGDLDGDGEEDCVLDVSQTSIAPRRLVCVSAKKGSVLWSVEPGTEARRALASRALRAGASTWLAIGEIHLPVPRTEPYGNEPGQVRIVDTTDGATVGRIRVGDEVTAGVSLASIDDRDADGAEDLLVGIPAAKVSEQRIGRAVLVSSRTGKVLEDLRCGAGLDRRELSGIGRRVDSVADIDGDEKRDYAVLVESALLRDSWGQRNTAFLELIGSKSGVRVQRFEIPDRQDRPAGFGARMFVAPSPCAHAEPLLIAVHSLATGPTGGNGALDVYGIRSGGLLGMTQGTVDGEYLGGLSDIIVREGVVWIVAGSSAQQGWHSMRLVCR